MTFEEYQAVLQRARDAYQALREAQANYDAIEIERQDAYIALLNNWGCR